MSYIDREALIKKISSISVTITGVRSGRSLLEKALTSYAEVVLKDISEAPTADVVEVVRCENCKHSVLINHFGIIRRCCKLENLQQFVNENQFCSYGIRKGN